MLAHAINRSYLPSSISFFAIAVFIKAAVAAEKPTSARAPDKSPRLHRWTNLDWAHWDIPLFPLFGPFDHQPNFSSIAKDISGGKSALDVYRFREVILAGDEKGITIRLNEQDSRVLKAFAQKHDRRWFVAVAPPKEFSWVSRLLPLAP